LKSHETAKHRLKSHHIETHKITTNRKKALRTSETLVSHTRKLIHLHPDPASALDKFASALPSLPQSGIGKDPRKKFEDIHWTEEQKAGHQAFVEKVQSRQDAGDN
jgi:hypothetical protein